MAGIGSKNVRMFFKKNHSHFYTQFSLNLLDHEDLKISWKFGTPYPSQVVISRISRETTLTGRVRHKS